MKSNTAPRPIAVVLAVVMTVATARVVTGSGADSLAASGDSATAVPQRDVGDVAAALLHREHKSRGGTSELRPGLSKTLLPVVGYNPSYGAYFGASVALGGWLGDPATTQLSAGNLGANYSTTGQISVQFKSDFFLSNNTWALKGDWRYLDTSQPTYGLGPANDGQEQYPMDFILYRLYQTVYHRVRRSQYYFGVGYHFDRYTGIHDTRAEAGESTPYSVYSRGTPPRSQSSGLSANVLTDTRDNPINGHRGVFWNASIRSFFKAFGSDVDRQTLFSDFRGYMAVSHDRRDVVAIWSYLWFTFGTPGYLELPASGWDTYGRGARGYVQGRIRGANQTYTEVEYRMPLTPDGLWGGVAFVNMTGTTQPDGGKFGRPDFGAGVGMRLKFNKTTDTNLAVDAGWGQDDKIRFFFGLQEAF